MNLLAEMDLVKLDLTCKFIRLFFTLVVMSGFV